jgi:hypothetical protein
VENHDGCRRLRVVVGVEERRLAPGEAPPHVSASTADPSQAAAAAAAAVAAAAVTTATTAAAHPTLDSNLPPLDLTRAGQGLGGPGPGLDGEPDVGYTRGKQSQTPESPADIELLTAEVTDTLLAPYQPPGLLTVRRCKLTVSKPELNARLVSALETKM